MKKKALAIFLCIAMVLTLTPFTSSAAELKERNRSKEITHQYDEVLFDALANGEVTDLEDIFYNMTKVINLSDAKYGLTGGNYGQLTNNIRFTKPEIVGIEMVYQKFKASGAVLGYYAQMYDGYDTARSQMKQRLPEVMNEVYARIPKGASDFEKVHIVHDYLISCSAYNQDNLRNDVFEGTDHDAAGVFLKHKGMCQGYSLAFKYVMDKLGIECGVVTSAKASHAWNVVKLGKDWYHVDLTGDDKGYDTLGRCEHTYLCLCTDSLLALDSDRSDFIVYLDNYNQSFTDDTCAVSRTYENGSVAGELNYSLDSYSPCIYYNNAVYTVNADNNIEKFDKATGKNTVFAEIPLMESVWHPYSNEGARYTNQVPRFAVLAYSGGNTAYINSTKHIYEVNLDTGAMKEIYALNAEQQYAIYGVAIVEDELKCEITDVAGEKTVNWTKVKAVEIPEAEIPAETPEKEYSETKEINLNQGESQTITLNGVNVKSVTDTAKTDAAVAKITVTDSSKEGTPATPATTTKMSSFKTGTYVLGYESGSTKKYLVNNGGTLTVTDDADKASKWTLSGSSSTCYLQNNGLYLNHSTTGISLTSSKVAWKFSTGRFYYQQSLKKYYLTYSSGFKMSTSTTSSAAAYTVKAGTAAVPGELYSTVKIDAIGAGNTSFAIGDVLYNVNVKVIEKKYSDTKNISITKGETETITLNGVNIKADTDTSMTDASVAKVTVVDVNKPGTAATPATTTKMSSFKTGTYVLGYESGSTKKYLVNNGGTLAVTDDADKASKWTLSGSSSTCYLQNNGSYLNHSTTGISLTSSKVAWKFSTGRFYYQQSTKKYYLTYSSGFKMSTSTTASAAAYTVKAGTPAVEGEKYSTVTVNALSEGQTSFEIGDVLYKITVKQAASTPVVEPEPEPVVEPEPEPVVEPEPVTPPAESGTDFALDGNGIDSGSSYIIVNNGYAIAGLSAIPVSVKGTYISDPKNENAVWKITKTTSGYTVYNETTGKYLSFKASGTGSAKTCTPMLSATKKYWKATQSGTGIQLYVTSTYNFYLTCTKGSFTMTKTATAVDLYKVK